MRYIKWILISVILVPLPGRTQAICRINESVGKCQSRLSEEGRANSLQTAGQAIEETVRSKPSPADFSDSPAGSSKKDFLPQLLAGLQSAKLDNQKQELDIAWNLKRETMDLQIQSVVHKPDLLKPLKDKLTSSEQTARIGELESDLGDLDDVSIGVSYNLENNRFGRRFEKNRDTLFVPLFRGVLTKVEGSSERTIAALNRRNALLDELNLGTDLEKIGIANIPANKRPEIEQAILDLADAEAALDREESQAIKSHRLTAFANLVDNQPQLTATVSNRWKGKEVGPDEFSAQINLEYGFFSVNGYRNKVPPCTTSDASQQTQCDGKALEAFDNYTKSFRAKAGMRFKFTAEYKWIQGYSRHSEADRIDFDLPSTNRLALTATYGQRVLFNEKGEELARVDITGSYENFSDDPIHKDRGTIDLSYTQKISNNFSFPIGITYANHGQFLGDVQKRVGVHFGFHAKIFTGN